ncbi:AAA family ATPase [uncultured Friedmanniella sp.]|uniref:AAA family ATPase n=1 Tax=uncultured Friedmanniella sp. TaxID=335381 RepID=UPI0035CA399B
MSASPAAAAPSVQSLTERVFGELLEKNRPDRTIDLVLAALEGPSELDAVLDGGSSPERPQPVGERTAPAGAFLAGLEVEGFRGIGPRTQLYLHPGPGLTVISGRNGSGKSSLAEALECALTGTTTRWQRRVANREFQAAWRNLHHPHVCRIEVALAQVEAGEATLTASWPQGETDVSRPEVSYQVAGQRQQKVQDALGWHAALQTYRPMLSYDDLGHLLTAKPSELHDSIAGALALDELQTAIALLRDRAAPLKRPAKEASDARKTLKATLEQADDARARAAAKLLNKTSPDLDALTALTSGDGTPDSRQTVLAQIATVRAPDPAAAQTVADILDAANAARDQLGGERDELDARREHLLHDALRFQEVSGDTNCPVCGTGGLDASWRSRTVETLARTDVLREQTRQAEQALQDAESAAHRLLTNRPAALLQSTVDLSTQAAAADAWLAWEQPAAGASLADHLRQQASRVAEQVLAWQAEARTLADEAAERWRPLALRISGYILRQQGALASADQARDLGDAYTAAVATEKIIRDERLQPIVDHARAIWAQLRHESNVELLDIELTGNATRRAVDIQAVVDDAGSNALSVMSQGELNSLALALFLPRAASDASPFRFLVLDDPVQSMDPNKVEGLASVLAELARTRQVIVFSHDDRLAQAARRLPDPPKILEVNRSSGSAVVVRNVQRPTERYLQDAHALLKELKMSDAVKRRVLPGVLRRAVETAAWERYSGQRLKAGVQLDVVEAAWDAADRTRERLELALGASLQPWLERESFRKRAVAACNAGSHQGLTSNLEETYNDVQRLVRAIESSSA